LERGPGRRADRIKLLEILFDDPAAGKEAAKAGVRRAQRPVQPAATIVEIPKLISVLDPNTPRSFGGVEVTVVRVSKRNGRLRHGSLPDQLTPL
jgi:hypothetical protein